MLVGLYNPYSFDLVFGEIGLRPNFTYLSTTPIPVEICKGPSVKGVEISFPSIPSHDVVNRTRKISKRVKNFGVDQKNNLKKKSNIDDQNEDPKLQEQ